jgi:DNA-binding CsgD family transcriptional regulator
MDHLILGIRTLALMGVLVGAVSIHQAARDQDLPFLKPWLGFTLFLGLDHLSPVVFGYFKLNLAAPGFQSPLGVLVLADVGLHFTATAGMAALWLVTSRRLVGARVHPRAWLIFVLAVVVAAFLHGTGLAGGAELDLFLTQLGTGIAAWALLLLVTLGLLFDTRRLPDTDIRRATGALGLLYLPGFLALVLLLLIMPADRVRLVALTMLYLSLVPLLWLPLFFRPAWERRDLLAGSTPVLDRLATEHDLTRREREILERLLQGRTGKELADELFISVSTVKNHTYNLYRKLGVNSRHQLYRLVLAEERDPDGRTG